MFSFSNQQFRLTKGDQYEKQMQKINEDNLFSFTEGCYFMCINNSLKIYRQHPVASHSFAKYF